MNVNADSAFKLRDNNMIFEWFLDFSAHRSWCWKWPARAHCFYKHRKVCWTAVSRHLPVGTMMVQSVCSQCPISVMEVRASPLPLGPMGPAAWVAPVCMDLWGQRRGAEGCHLNPCFLPFRILSMFPSLDDLLGFVYHINKHKSCLYGLLHTIHVTYNLTHTFSPSSFKPPCLPEGVLFTLEFYGNQH